jgi:polyhydroxyalkanoate synthesis regulator phasin
MATKTAAFPGLAQAQESLKGLQEEAEKLIARVGKEAGRLISKDQRKVLDSLVSQAQSIRADIQKRTEKALQAIESRAGKVYARVESETRKRIDALVRRLPLATKHDVELLAKRLTALEKKVEELASSKSRAA